MTSGFEEAGFKATDEQRADKTRNIQKRDMTEPLEICTDPNCNRATWFYHKPHGAEVGGPPAMDRPQVNQQQPRGYTRTKA